MSHFDSVFGFTISWETGGDLINGGLHTDKDDPGGTTKFGISQRAHPSVDVVNLSLEQAREIYIKQYFDPILGPGIVNQTSALALFDFAVNSGVYRAVKVLQKVLGFTGRDLDGHMGPKTMDAFNEHPDSAGLLCLARLDFMKTLKHWPKYKNGWTKRVNQI